MDDIYQNTEEYNRNKKRKLLIVWKKITFFKMTRFNHAMIFFKLTD